MQTGSVIRKYRRLAKMTQEEMADRLGVTTSAVSKWENGNTQPDIELLAPIARLLNISIDTLLSFERELSVNQSSRLVEEIYDDLNHRPYGEVMEKVQALQKEYPNCGRLNWQLTALMDAWCNLHPDIDRQQYDALICRSYQRLVKDEDEVVRRASADSLYGYYMKKQDYEQAQQCLQYFSKENTERERKQAVIYEKTGNTEQAYGIYEGLLYRGYHSISLLFNSLFRLYANDGNYENARLMAEKMGQLADLFDMGERQESMMKLELAVEQNESQEIEPLLQQIVESEKNVNAYARSVLYQHLVRQYSADEKRSQLEEEIRKFLCDKEIFGYMIGNEYWESLKIFVVNMIMARIDQTSATCKE